MLPLPMTPVVPVTDANARVILINVAFFAVFIALMTAYSVYAVKRLVEDPDRYAITADAILIRRRLFGLVRYTDRIPFSQIVSSQLVGGLLFVQTNKGMVRNLLIATVNPADFLARLDAAMAAAKTSTPVDRDSCR